MQRSNGLGPFGFDGLERAPWNESSALDQVVLWPLREIGDEAVAPGGDARRGVGVAAQVVAHLGIRDEIEEPLAALPLTQTYLSLPKSCVARRVVGQWKQSRKQEASHG